MFLWGGCLFCFGDTGYGARVSSRLILQRFGVAPGCAQESMRCQGLNSGFPCVKHALWVLLIYLCGSHLCIFLHFILGIVVYNTVNYRAFCIDHSSTTPSPVVSLFLHHFSRVPISNSLTPPMVASFLKKTNCQVLGGGEFFTSLLCFFISHRKGRLHMYF